MGRVSYRYIWNGGRGTIRCREKYSKRDQGKDGVRAHNFFDPKALMQLIIALSLGRTEARDGKQRLYMHFPLITFQSR